MGITIEDCWARGFSFEQAERLTGLSVGEIKEIYILQEKRMREYFRKKQKAMIKENKLCDCGCHEIYKFWRTCCGKAGIEEPKEEN